MVYRSRHTCRRPTCSGRFGKADPPRSAESLMAIDALHRKEEFPAHRGTGSQIVCPGRLAEHVDVHLAFCVAGEHIAPAGVEERGEAQLIVTTVRSTYR